MPKLNYNDVTVNVSDSLGNQKVPMFYTITWSAEAVSMFGTLEYVCEFAAYIAKPKALNNVLVGISVAHAQDMWSLELVEEGALYAAPKLVVYSYSGHWATELATFITANRYRGKFVWAKILKYGRIRHLVQSGVIVETFDNPQYDPIPTDWLES